MKPVDFARIGVAIAVIATFTCQIGAATAQRTRRAQTAHVSAPNLQPGIDLGQLQVRLWYEGTGRLSGDIAPPSPFAIWNTIIGEGDAEEIADDALATVEVLSSGHEVNVAAPLVMEARDARGRILARRVFANILTSSEGRSVKGLWLPDIGCAGAVNVTATLGPIRRSVRVQMDCGE